MLPRIILTSNSTITSEVFDSHYALYKPVLAQITNANVQLTPNAQRVLVKAAQFNTDITKSTVDHHKVSQVLNIDPSLDVGALKTVVDQMALGIEVKCFSSQTLSTKYVNACKAMQSDNIDFQNNASHIIEFGMKNQDIPLHTASSYLSLVEKVADFHGIVDHACLVKIQAFCQINECITCLVVEHRICMIIGTTLFIQHMYYKIHTQNGAFERFISDVADRTYVKFTKMHTRVLRIAYAYRAPLLRVAAIGISGTAVGAGLKYWTQSPAESRYTFTGPLGQLFKEVSSILVKITYSTISTLTDVQMAIFRATFGKRAELFVEWLKDLNEKIKKN